MGVSDSVANSGSAADSAVHQFLVQEAERQRQERESQALVMVYLVTRHPGESYEAWLARWDVRRDNACVSNVGEIHASQFDESD